MDGWNKDSVCQAVFHEIVVPVQKLVDILRAKRWKGIFE
jgi:hypothetical protein